MAVQDTRTLITAAKETGVRRIVRVSIARLENTQPAIFGEEAALGDACLARQGPDASVKPLRAKSPTYGDGSDLLFRQPFIGLVLNRRPLATCSRGLGGKQVSQCDHQPVLLPASILKGA